MDIINEHQIYIFGFNITRWPRWAILILGACGVFISFVSQGTSQEQLYHKYQYKETIFFTFVQFFGYFTLTIPYFIKVITKKVKLKASFPIGNRSGLKKLLKACRQILRRKKICITGFLRKCFRPKKKCRFYGTL